MQAEFIREKEAAQTLAVSPRLLSKWRSLGSGPPFARFGGAIRYDPDELRQWAKKQTVRPVGRGRPRLRAVETSQQ